MPNATANTATAEFKGFADWVEVFAAGTHTDSQGQTKTWSEADLDEMVRNFNADDPFPLVIGHPKTDSPAYGWGAAVKREGGKLLSQFAKVPDAVEKAAQTGAYRNRSAKIVKTASGHKLVHVGLLGATPPAIEGLAAVYNAADEGETYEFSGLANSLPWLARSMARMGRALRDFAIGKWGQEDADKALPAWPIEELERIAAQAEADASKSFSAPPAPALTQADIDAAVATAVTAARAEEAAKRQPLEAQLRESAHAQALAANQAFVSTLISDLDAKVRLTPAEARGWAAALTYAQQLQGSEFTFAAGDGAEQKPTLYEFMKGKLAALAPRLELGRERATQDCAVDVNDADALQRAASEFQASEAKAGREINIAQAVQHIKNTRRAA